ncbi:MAG: flagellar export chaperone FlgN [Planctomycetota bacterium]|nr:flagellar export chaperone FlgN [Planctomycetota bacterium]
MRDASGKKMAAARADEAELMGVQLAELLEDLSAEYGRIHDLGERRERALRNADTKALGACLQEESGAVERIVALDRRRAGVVGFFASRFEARTTAEITATWIAERIGDEGLAKRIRESATGLRDVIVRVKQSNDASRLAVETLAGHMQGLLRAAAERMSHSGAYGRKGTVESGQAVMSAVDVTS